MGKTTTTTVTVNPGEAPDDCVVVRVTHPKTGALIEGANVVLMAKTHTAPRIEKVTDINGRAFFWHGELTLVVLGDPTAVEWCIIADIPDSEYGYIKDRVRLSISVTQGQVIWVTLKHYKTVPTLFLRFNLKDVIGRDLWAGILTKINEWALGWSSYKIVGVEGVGTNTVTIKFKPPWTEHSPFAITLTASTGFIISLIVFFGGIIASIVIASWMFGVETVTGFIQALPWILGALVVLEVLRRF